MDSRENTKLMETFTINTHFCPPIFLRTYPISLMSFSDSNCAIVCRWQKKNKTCWWKNFIGFAMSGRQYLYQHIFLYLSPNPKKKQHQPQKKYRLQNSISNFVETFLHETEHCYSHFVISSPSKTQPTHK